MSTEGLGWGAIQQNFPEASWTESSTNRLQVESWDKQPSSGNWGTDKPSAPSPSENHLSARKTVQGSWGPNKSENSWNKNESVQVDQSTWQTRKEEPAISASEYKNKRDDEIDAGIERSFESLRNDDYDRQPIVLDEDDYDSRYNSFSTSNKPQLGKLTSTPYEEIPFNTSEAYDAKSRVEPFIMSSNSTFQELPNKEYRDVEVQTDPIDISKLIASNEKLLSCKISSPIKKEYQRSNSATSSVSEKRYPPQQISLLDADLEEYTSTTTPKPNSDSWDSKPTSVQNNSWNAAQRTSVRNENRGPVPQTIPVTPDSWDGPQQSPARNDNRGSVPQMVPVTSDSWNGPQQPPARNDNRGSVPQMVPVTSDSRNGPQQPPARNDNRGSVPQMVPVTPDSWDGSQQPPARNENRGPVPQTIPVTPDSWDGPQQPPARNDNRGPVPQTIPVTPDSWDGPQQPPARNENRGPVPQTIPVTPDSWDGPQQPPERNDNRDPVPQSTPLPQASAKNDNSGTVPQQIPVEPDSWDSAPQTTAKNNRGSDFQPKPSWSTVSQPMQNNSWDSGPQKPSSQGDAASRPSDPTSDWTKKAEMFAKELGESSEIKVWEPTSNVGQRAEDSYGTGASDFYHDNSSSNNRNCRNCGQEGHYARDCPNKKQSGCHKCGKEGHFARDCPEESGYGGGREYGGGKSCHKCGKEGHFARDCQEESSRSGYGGGRSCHKCGKEGHFIRDCPEESSRGGYGGGRSCHKCGEEGHIARDCRKDAYETTGEDGGYGGRRMSREFSSSSMSRPHTKTSPFSNPEPSDISSQEAWAKLLKASDELDVEDFKEALELYAKANPEETFVSIERKLRAENCNGRIIALERPEIPLTKVLVDLQGNTNKKYVARPIMCHPSRLPRTSGKRADSEEENLVWLADAGFMVDDYSPVCFNCKQKGHITKDCTVPKREVEKPSYLTCQNCHSSDHVTKFCPEERRDYYLEARDRKVSGSHKGEYSANEDRASSGYDGEDDRRGYRGYGSNSSQVCHNCNREGHISRNCPEAKRSGGDGASSGYNGEDDRRGYRGYSNNSNQICHNCDREGHISRECPEPKRGGRKCNTCGKEGHISKDCTGSSGGNYDRGNYNSNGGWQRDSSSRNNDQTASRSTRDKGGDNTWNKARSDNTTLVPTLSPRENSWNNPSGGDSSRGDYYNAQNKSQNDTYDNNKSRNSPLHTQNEGRDTSRQRDNQPVIPEVESDSWDTKPKTTDTSGGNEWGSKTAEDFGWGNSNENKSSTPGDYESRRGRGNDQRERTSVPDDYDNNRRGRGIDQRGRTYDDHDNNRRGRGNDQRERAYDDYDNNRRGRGNDQRERTYDDHDNNRRGRGRGNDQRERAYDNYDNRRGRGNDPRESTNKGPDHDRLSNSSRTRSNDVNNQPWW